MLDFDTWNPFHHELCSNLCFELIHILFPEKELTVQVGKIDCIHINHCDILNSAQSKILKNFTSKATSTDDKNFGSLLDCFEKLIAWLKYLLRKVTLSAVQDVKV
jgi:hypothetical protein